MSYEQMPPSRPGDYGEWPARSNGLAVAALVCGIVGLFIANLILGPLAIIFGAIGLQRANRGAGRRTMSAWGLGLGIVALVLGIIAIVAISNSNGFTY